MGTCGTPRLKRKRRRRAEDKQQYLEYCRVGSTIDTGCRRRETRCLLPPVLSEGRGVAERNWGLYGEADKARTRAGHRAIDGTVLRRNASEVKSSTSAPLLSTTHSHAGNGRKSILAAIVYGRGPPRSGKRNPLSLLLVQEENMGIRSASRVRIFCASEPLVDDVTRAKSPSFWAESGLERRRTEKMKEIGSSFHYMLP